VHQGGVKKKRKGHTFLITTEYIDHMGSDLSVCNSARVSFGKRSSFDGRVGGPNVLKDSDVKLIKYLAAHKHTSPFGHCFASFHVKAPLFVARQLVKHKFLRWNEISRRYVDSKPEFYEPNEWRGKSANKKQGSDGVVPFYIDQDMQWCRQVSIYENMLDNGVCPEQARIVLPQSMMTEWYWSGSLDAFADMCVLRCAEDTQYESRVVADQISLKMKELFPISWIALVPNKSATNKTIRPMDSDERSRAAERSLQNHQKQG
jgi:thymidylate synthase (FAD)